MITLLNKKMSRFAIEEVVVVDRQPRTWLIRMRHQRRMSQQQLAMRAKISRNYLSEIECGVKNPSVLVSKRIAQVMGCDWIQFF